MKKRFALILVLVLLGSLLPSALTQAEHADDFTFFLPWNADRQAEFFRLEGQLTGAGNPINEGELAAEAAFAGIMMRESCYTRMNFKRSWFMSKCQLDLLPTDHLDLAGARHVDPVPVPGKYVLPGAPGRKRR